MQRWAELGCVPSGPPGPCYRGPRQSAQPIALGYLGVSIARSPWLPLLPEGGKLGHLGCMCQPLGPTCWISEDAGCWGKGPRLPQWLEVFGFEGLSGPLAPLLVLSDLSLIGLGIKCILHPSVQPRWPPVGLIHLSLTSHSPTCSTSRRDGCQSWMNLERLGGLDGRGEVGWAGLVRGLPGLSSLLEALTSEGRGGAQRWGPGESPREVRSLCSGREDLAGGGQRLLPVCFLSSLQCESHKVEASWLHVPHTPFSALIMSSLAIPLHDPD